MTRGKEAGAADVGVYEQSFVIISLIGVGRIWNLHRGRRMELNRESWYKQQSL
ncbi:hypothetical protein SAMN04488688_11592 [Paenibacillus sp. cl141a]|nr:hypothetical protein SAMN04488688_11592 [Paenibacillus sp. cl141a]